MGEFVYIDSKAGEKQSWGNNQKKPEKMFLQLIPATVMDVVMSDNPINSPGFDGPSTINCIIAKPHYGHFGTKATVNKLYYPLLRGMVDVPIKGDSVLLLSNTGGANYYLGPLNALNSPNFNIDPLNKSSENHQKGQPKSTDPRKRFNIPPNYRFANVARLQTPYNEALDNRREDRLGAESSIAYRETYGDMLFEGRYGNSIRLGYNDNCPKVIISNGRNGISPVETLYDGSIFSMTTHGSLTKHFHNFSLPSDIVEGNSRLIGGGNSDESQAQFNYNYGDDDNGKPILRNQIFMGSDKITIGARADNLTLSSFINLDIGVGNNLTINTKNYTSIESSNIYLGKQAQEQKEPIVLGTQLKSFLVKILSTMMKATSMVQGAPVPLTDEQGVNGKLLAEYFKDLIDELENASFLSEYHFVEDNGQKTE
tara:strand:+ start:2163 stop:3440 length:1278 start_codon:yes stop_codon:yes gene_type:complete